jgi:hypothetical protein
MTEREKMVRDAELVFNRLMPKLHGDTMYKAEVVDGEDGHPMLTIGGMTIESARLGKTRLWDVSIERTLSGGREEPPTSEQVVVVGSEESFWDALPAAISWYYAEAARNLLSDQAMADDMSAIETESRELSAANEADQTAAADFGNDMARSWEPPTEE